MRRYTILLFSLIIASAAAAQQCTTNLAFSAIQPGTPITDRPWGVTFANCPNVTATTFTEGSSGSLTLGGTVYEAIIERWVPANAANPNPQLTFRLKLPQGANDPTQAFYATNAATFQYPVNGTAQTWTLTLTEALNVYAHSFHIGRADANQPNQPAIPPAYQLQITSTYSYRPPFIPSGASASFFSRIQRDFSFSIDTTDKGTGYIDDNSVAYGMFLPRLNLGGIVAQGKIGAAVDYQRPIHNDNHNGDATLTAAGYLPFLKAINVFNTQPKAASPLALALSYGYRSSRMSGSTYRGRVFSGTAFYHLYLMNSYRIDLTATTTYNDLNNLPAGTPKTQHAFTAAVYYEPSPNAPFNAVAQFQNGSFGAVLTNLKQYFIGVSVAKIDSYFASKQQTP